jgi:glycosyltransferase involved in cell wall biosynthesis
MIRAGRAAGSWARSRGADVLHGHGLRWAPLFASAARAARLPLVVTLHNLVPAEAGASLARRLVLRAAFASTERVIAVAQAVADSATRTGIVPDPTRRLVVIPNGVDVSRFAPDALRPDRASTRAALGLFPDAPVALCVARLSPEKDVANFLRAAARVRAERDLSHARFLVAGDGPLRADLARQADDLGLVAQATLLGARPDIPALLSAADLLCLPSREEGLSLAALEAMAAGLPVVATRVGGLPEAIVDNETGLLVRPAIRPRLPPPSRACCPTRTGRTAWVPRARARVVARFSQETMVRATFALHAEVTQ